MLPLFVGLSLGCGNSRPQTIEVRGRVTLNGGDWPGGGIVAFRPIKSAEGFIRRSGHARFDSQGTFSVSTYDTHDGLIPGEYEVLIIYEEPGQGENAPPKVLIEGHDRLIVPADGSGPVDYQYDVTSKLKTVMLESSSEQCVNLHRTLQAMFFESPVKDSAHWQSSLLRAGNVS